jgi:hypothetical protein
MYSHPHRIKVDIGYLCQGSETLVSVVVHYVQRGCAFLPLTFFSRKHIAHVRSSV